MTIRGSFHGWALLGAVLLGCGGSARSSTAAVRLRLGGARPQLGDAVNPEGEREAWLQHLVCP